MVLVLLVFLWIGNYSYWNDCGGYCLFGWIWIVIVVWKLILVDENC